MPLPDPFPVARYRLEFEVERAMALPPYAGSALRGVFGHALRHAACVTGMPNCKPCPLWRRCAYPALFETPPPEQARRVYSEIPQPYVVEPPPEADAARLRPGTTFCFHVVLIGPALAQLPLVLLAWQRALEGGVGAGDGGCARLRRVWLHGDDAEPVLEGPGGRLRPHSTGVACPPEALAPEAVRVELLTPMRLKREGRVLGVYDRVTPADLLHALVRRTADLCELQLGLPTGFDFASLRERAARVQGEASLRWHGAARWSNRQQQAVPMDGLIGHLTLRGELGPLWPLLYLGQWLHVGGKATLGLGAYRLAPVRDPAPVSAPLSHSGSRS
jgi:hypothetical protein